MMDVGGVGGCDGGVMVAMANDCDGGHDGDVL